MDYSKRIKTKRIDYVDCLRGFAIIGIILLHFAEQFNLSSLTEHSAVDNQFLDLIRFFIANKVYSIFALLFGFSAYIQYEYRKERGYDFRPRFAWRMFVLLGFGILNMSIYSGDILCIFALYGLLLIPFFKASNKVTCFFVLVLFLQPIGLFNMARILLGCDVEPLSDRFSSYFLVMQDAWMHGTFMDVCRSNLANEFFVKIGSYVDNERFTKLFFMMLVGLLMCKKRLFIDEGKNMMFWKRLLVVAIVLFTFIFVVKRYIIMTMPSSPFRYTLLMILMGWRELCFTAVYVSGLTLLYYRTRLHHTLHHIRHLGKMALTCYLQQSICGTFLFCNWGLGLYRSTSYVYSFLIGMVFMVLLHTFCRYWAKRHRRGPLEQLWNKAMWIDKIYRNDI